MTEKRRLKVDMGELSTVFELQFSETFAYLDLETGEVISHYLDTSEDKHLDAVDMALKEEKADLNMTDFMDELGKLGKSALDFKDAMKQFLHSGKTSPEAKQIILKAMEK